MPSGKTHAIIGGLLAAGLFFYFQYRPEDDLVSIGLLVLIVFLYSQAPDCDHPMSRSTVYVNFLAMGLMAYFLYNEEMTAVWIILILLGFLWFLRLIKALHHRGFCHSFIFPFIAAAPVLYFFGQVYFVYAVACGMSHVVADKVSTSFKKKKERERGKERRDFI